MIDIQFVTRNKGKPERLFSIQIYFIGAHYKLPKQDGGANEFEHWRGRPYGSQFFTWQLSRMR